MLSNQVWEDQSLLNWDSNDYRLFAGDLGNDVTDEVLNFFPFSTALHLGPQVLSRTFGRYPSFQMAKVVRDKRSNKTKGYGFVSFESPDDFTKAIKEMNGETDNISIACFLHVIFSRSICGLKTDQAEQIKLERQECGCCEGEAAPEEEDGIQILSGREQYPFVTAFRIAEYVYLIVFNSNRIQINSNLLQMNQSELVCPQELRRYVWQRKVRCCILSFTLCLGSLRGR